MEMNPQGGLKKTMTIKQIINYEYFIIQQTAEGGNDRKQ